MYDVFPGYPFWPHKHHVFYSCLVVRCQLTTGKKIMLAGPPVPGKTSYGSIVRQNSSCLRLTPLTQYRIIVLITEEVQHAQMLKVSTLVLGKLPVLQTSTDNSVLNLWRTHWKSSRDGPVDRKPSLPINQSWTGRLTKAEEIVKFSVERVPLMSPLLLTALKSIRTIHIRDSS